MWRWFFPLPLREVHERNSSVSHVSAVPDQIFLLQHHELLPTLTGVMWCLDRSPQGSTLHKESIYEENELENSRLLGGGGAHNAVLDAARAHCEHMPPFRGGWGDQKIAPRKTGALSLLQTTRLLIQAPSTSALAPNLFPRPTFTRARPSFQMRLLTSPRSHQLQTCHALRRRAL